MRNFSVILIILFLIYISYHISQSNIKAELSEANDKQIFVRLPKVYFGVGLVCAVFFASPFVLTPLFPDVFVGGTLWVWILFSFFVLLGVFLMIETKIWRIEIQKDKDYFIYRTWLGKTYTIKYEECENYKKTSNDLILKTKNKTFYIDQHAVNFDVFMSMLLKVKVNRR